jgi:hypothetical protein
MDIHYTKGKLSLVLMKLALSEGDLRARVPDACGELLAASYRKGFETEFETIDRITEKVSKGDWTNVSDDELKEIALAIWRLNERMSFSPLNPR